MEPFYIIDGSGYIFRAFYAIAPLSNAQGLPTNGLFGFTRMLTKLIRDMKAKYICVTFDTKQPTFRHEMYSEYKANRSECPAELVPQMPYFRSIVEAMGIRSLEKPGFEADDIIGTLAARCREIGQEVVIVSGDKDLLQLVDDRISVLDGMRDTKFSREQVKEKFGVFPEQVVDYLAIIGDASDNVPGLKGVGPKSAEKLLEHFGSLENLLKNPQEIEGISGLRGAKSIREKVESGTEALRLSRKLVSLDINVPPYNLLENVEEFAFEHVRTDLLHPLFTELEFTGLLNALEFAGAAKGESSTASHYEKKFYTLVGKDNWSEFLEEFLKQPRFAFDTETSSLDVLECELFGISVSWETNTGYYIPVGGESAEGLSLDPAFVREALGPRFRDPTVEKSGLNLKFDIGVLEEQGYVIHGIGFDAMLAAHLLHPDRRTGGLKGLAEQYLNERMVTYEEVIGEFENIGQTPLTDLSNYACHDADASWTLSERLSELLGIPVNAGPSMRKAFEDVEMPLVRVLSRIERAGIGIDVGFLERLGIEFVGELGQLERDIWRLAGKEFNINSPKQLSAVLFEDLALPTAGVKKKQGGYSTDASVLSQLQGVHEIADKLLEYRELHKLNSTYVVALQKMVHPRTGRIHTSLNQAIAATGRLSSTDPNLQNIPIKTSRGRRLRNAFVARPGARLLSVDYSQIELRVLAHLSGDAALRQAFIDGEDIHTRTAKELFGASLMSPEETKDLRRIAKTINFGIIYGMSAFRLANELEVSRKQASQYIEDYFGRYPKVQLYFDSLKQQIESQGYVETLFGRRRFVHEIDTTGRDGGYAERSLLNAAIQGTAAEVIKRAMILLDTQLEPYGKSARMVLQVHDELVFEVDHDKLPEIEQLVVKTMESAVPLEVPLKVEYRSGVSWGDEV